MSDSATTAWVSAVVSAGGTVSAGREAHVDALVVGLKNDGVWTKLDRLWLFAAENTQSALIDLVATDQATAVNSPSFTADQGYTGNGTNSYINTTYLPGTDGPNWTGNAASFGVWQRSTPAARNEVQMGANYFGHPSQIANFFGDNNSYTQVNCSTSLTTSGTAVAGLYAVDRSASNFTTLYINATASGTSTAVATAETDCNMFVLGRNDNSGSDSLTNPSTAQVSAAFLGGSLGASDQTDLYNRLVTYLAFAPPADTNTVDKADITLAGQSVTVLDVVPVDLGEIGLAGKVINFQNTEAVSEGTITLTGQSVSVLDLVAVAHGTITLAGQDVTIPADQSAGSTVTVDQGTITFAGQDVSPVEVLGLVSVDNGTITFSGQDVTVTSTETGTRGYIRPFEDFGRSQRRRMKALEPILERRRKKIRELERQAEKKAEELRKAKIQPTTPEKQEKVAEIAHELDQVKMHLLGMQMRAETARQELLQLQLMQAALEEDEEEIAIALLLH